MFVHTGGRPRRSWILLALLVPLWVAVSALFGVLTQGILVSLRTAMGAARYPPPLMRETSRRALALAVNISLSGHSSTLLARQIWLDKCGSTSL